MTSLRLRCLSTPPAKQSGVVLFVALVAMVVLTLAGIGLVRSVDSATSAAGNLAFRQASIAQVNLEVEKAVDAIFKSRVINTVNDDATHGYFAALQGGEKPDGTPAALAGSYSTMKSAYSALGFPVDTDPVTNIESRIVIERVCSATGAPTIQICDLMPPKQSPGGTDNEVKTIPIPPIPHFRVSVRVDLPNTNAHSIAQTFLR